MCDSRNRRTQIFSRGIAEEQAACTCRPDLGSIGRVGEERDDRKSRVAQVDAFKRAQGSRTQVVHCDIGTIKFRRIGPIGVAVNLSRDDAAELATQDSCQADARKRIFGDHQDTRVHIKTPYLPSPTLFIFSFFLYLLLAFCLDNYTPFRGLLRFGFSVL